MLLSAGMLIPHRLPTTSAFLEARPQIDALIESHATPLPCCDVAELREWMYETIPDQADHTLVTSGGQSIGLVPRWKRESDPRQVVIGLGAFDGPVVIGRDRTLALLGFMRSLAAETAEWDVLLASGPDMSVDLRRLETACKCERYRTRMIPVGGSSVMAILSPNAFRARWFTSTASDQTLIDRWNLRQLIGVPSKPADMLTETIPTLRVVFDPSQQATDPPRQSESKVIGSGKTPSPTGSPASRRPPATRPPLRVVRPS